jgi:hypothetical protein
MSNIVISDLTQESLFTDLTDSELELTYGGAVPLLLVARVALFLLTYATDAN